jgi:hypothetical protein
VNKLFQNIHNFALNVHILYDKIFTNCFLNIYYSLSLLYVQFLIRNHSNTLMKYFETSLQSTAKTFIKWTMKIIFLLFTENYKPVTVGTSLCKPAKCKEFNKHFCNSCLFLSLSIYPTHSSAPKRGLFIHNKNHCNQ